MSGFGISLLGVLGFISSAFVLSIGSGEPENAGSDRVFRFFMHVSISYIPIGLIIQIWQ